MIRVLRELAVPLGPLRLGRQVFHVEAGTELHISATVVDAKTYAPLDGVGIIIEGSQSGAPTIARVARAGMSDIAGRLDAAVPVRWSYDTRTLDTESLPPSLDIVLTKAGYEDARIPSDLPLVASRHGVIELDLGRIAMAHR